MNANRHGWWIAAALISGFVAGALADRCLRGGPAFAEKGGAYQGVVAAQEFRLVDQEGRIRITLRMDRKDNLSLSLFDRQGKSRGGFKLNPEGRPSITIGKPGEERIIKTPEGNSD